MTNKKKQNNIKSEEDTSEDKINKEIPTNIEIQKNVDSGKVSHDIAATMSAKLYPDWFKKSNNISAPWNPSINPLLSSISATSSLFDSMKTVTSIADIYRPPIIGTTIPDYSKIGVTSSSMDFLSSLNNPIASFDIPKPISYVNDKSLENLRDFNYSNTNKINKLTKDLEDTLKKLKSIETQNKSKEESDLEIKKLKDKIKILDEELHTHKNKGHIISRINTIYISQLLNSEEFFEEFKHLKDVDAVVISIDIRRSTELMLKAVSPQHFANFITELSKHLSDCVKSNYGVFDKFTGDGILGFFPNFLSGKHALLYALKTAIECHEIFKLHYDKHQYSFEMFNEDVGLGIGIEYGQVAIVNNNVELTVVGTPVVYACRLAGAPAGETFLGIRAMQIIEQNFENLVQVEKDILSIKHDGTIRVFKLKKLKLLLDIPDWSKYIKAEEISKEKSSTKKVSNTKLQKEEIQNRKDQ